MPTLGRPDILITAETPVLTLFRITLLIALAPAVIATAQTSRPANTDVPVTKVVLFSSGVGYFEHAGTVHGNGATELRFKTSQINDILKSIMLQDQDGGRVGAITYPSQDPLAKTLRSFQIDITQNPSQAELLNQLRGAHVTIQARGATLAGTILGVETQRRTSEKGETTQVQILNLLTGATIHAVELQSIGNLSIDDPQLQDELTKALAALVQARDQDKKPVTINFAGAGDRRVRIGYVVETPVWKTSYRLLLDDKGASGKLQGWAIVENQTESDWHDVSLSLVSGRPISFTMDLYQPLYATRPVVVPELFAGLRPQLYDAGIGARADSARVMMAPAPMSPARRIGYGPDGRPSRVELNEVVVTGASASRDMMSPMSSVQSIAESGKLGALFQYTVGNVTLARQKSAMLPIITDDVSLERLSIFNASVLATNPLNGVLMKNTTGKHLLQGPLTVLDGGGYAGDSRIDDVPPGQSRLLSYGIDLDMTIDNTRSTQTSSVVSAKITKGTLVLSRRLVASQEYAADNKSAKDKTLLIEHPIRHGWKLADTQKPFETTPAVYRFKGTAVANKVTSLIVKEELVQNETLAMMPMEMSQLLTYSRNGEIPSAIRDALAKAIQIRQRMADVDRQIAAGTQQIAEITVEQTRIRENMKTVPQTGQYYERLLTKLNEQESSIEKLQAVRIDLTSKRDVLRRELEDYLNGLTVG
jgi:hypothetical protein